MSKRILVAEDSAAQRLSMKLSLQMRGFEVVAVEDGSAALNLFESGQCFDALVTDNEMPNLSGLELIATLRKQGRRVPIVLYCALREGSDVPDGIVYLSKTDRAVSFDVIARTLSRLIGE